MTSPATLQVKMIAALLEAIDADDVKDAEQAIRMVKAMLELGKQG
jgi:hypothetical protein